MQLPLEVRVEALRQEVLSKQAKCLADCQAGLAAMEQAKQAVRQAQQTYVEGLFASHLLIRCCNSRGTDNLVTWWALGHLFRSTEIHRETLLGAQAQMDQVKAHLSDLKAMKARVDADVADIRARNALLKEEYHRTHARPGA